MFLGFFFAWTALFRSYHSISVGLKSGLGNSKIWFSFLKPFCYWIPCVLSHCLLHHPTSMKLQVTDSLIFSQKKCFIQFGIHIPSMTTRGSGPESTKSPKQWFFHHASQGLGVFPPNGVINFCPKSCPFKIAPEAMLNFDEHNIFLVCVGWLVGWLLCQQDYSKSSEPVLMKCGEREESIKVWCSSGSRNF